jgi:hypothetical protein
VAHKALQARQVSREPLAQQVRKVTPEQPESRVRKVTKEKPVQLVNLFRVSLDHRAFAERPALEDLPEDREILDLQGRLGLLVYEDSKGL